MTFPTDLAIAQQAKMLPIREIAKKLNISEDDIDPYGKYKDQAAFVLDRP